MTKYRVTDISVSNLLVFIDEIYEAEDDIDVKESVMNEIIDDIGNYIDIELEEIEDGEEFEDETI